MQELMEKACARVAQLSSVDAAYITCGAGAGQGLAVAACVAGDDSRKWRQLPVTDGMSNEVVIPRSHRIRFSPQWTAPGARLVEYGYLGNWRIDDREIADAITEKCCCLVYVESSDVDVRRQIRLEDVVEVAHGAGLPVIVDAAAMLPPTSRLHEYADMGVDITLFSGGKAIGAFNSTGIMLGKGEQGKKLLEVIHRYSFPHVGWGRGFKVSKEQIVSVVRALEIFLEEGDTRYEKEMQIANRFLAALSKIDGLEVCVIPNDETIYEHSSVAQVPHVKLEWDCQKLGLTSAELTKCMAAETPPVLLKRTITYFNHYSSRETCVINPAHLREGEEELVIERLMRVLAGRARSIA